MFARASSSVRPWLMASGTSTTCATHQPSPARSNVAVQEVPPGPTAMVRLSLTMDMTPPIAHSHTAAHETSRHAKTHLAGGLSLTGRPPAAETYRQGKRGSPETGAEDWKAANLAPAPGARQEPSCHGGSQPCATANRPPHTTSAPLPLRQPAPLWSPTRRRSNLGTHIKLPCPACRFAGKKAQRSGDLRQELRQTPALCPRSFSLQNA
jgi:hypothetical protein